ncbi:MAG: right-handed parallel beta-helix repeat-containing protein [Mariniphaga sp.]
MKKLSIYLILSLLLTSFAEARIFYVSNSGNDRNSGLEKSAPLQTLAKAATQVSPGDVILLRRGDLFRESVKITSRNIEVKAYGNEKDPLPIISGSVPITGFKPYQGGIYVAQTEVIPGYLFADNKLMTIARYPNEGWLRTTYWEDKEVPGDATPEQLARASSMIECPELTSHPSNADDFWVGANIRWRHHSWWFETREVVDYDAAGKLHVDDRSYGVREPHKGAAKGWGFYLDNKLELLDAPGEWYFDQATKRVYLYPPEGKNPNDMLIEGSVLSTGLSIADGVVQQVRFQHQQDIGLQIDGVSVVQYCEFEGIGRDAKVSERGAGGSALQTGINIRKSRVSHCTFRNNFNIAIHWRQNPNDTTSSVIERNLVQNSGVVDGYGGSGSWHAVAILIATGRNVHVQYNKIEKSGYVGILFGTDGNFAEYNIIKNAMHTLNDGGAIYTNCSRSTIRYNIILNTLGGLESSGAWANISHGIWPEFLREYRETIIEYNTIVNSGGDGIFLPNNYDCIVRNNVCYNNDRYQFLMIGLEERKQVNVKQNHLITGNVFYAADPTQNTFYFDDRNDYGTFKDNYFCKPSSDQVIHEGKSWPGMGRSTPFTLMEWQEKFSWSDPTPKTDVQKVSGEDNSAILINDSEQTKEFRLSGNWVNLDGEPVSGSVTLEPFTSIILVRDVL